MEEIWKDIKGYEGLYQVSNLGNVKSLNFNRTGKEKLLKPGINNKGYLYVNLYKDLKVKNNTIHRLVAQAFILNYENKPHINHKNGIKDDNRVENLERVTHSENHLHRFKVLGHKGSCLGKFGKLHHSSKKVNQYDLEGNFIKTWDCIRDIERQLKINHRNISACCLMKRNKAGGFIWKYKI